MTADRPLSDEDRRQLRLIIGDAPDTVARMHAWCEANNAEVTHEAGVYTATAGGEVLATARDLAVLLNRLASL